MHSPDVCRVYNSMFLVQEDTVKRSIIIALDYPLNNSTTFKAERVAISKKYSIPNDGMQIVLLTRELMQMNLVRITALRGRSVIMAAPVSLVKCDICGAFTKRSNMLSGCSLGHLCCAHHLIPWNRVAGCPVYEESRAVYLALENSVNLLIEQRVPRHPMDFKQLETLAMLLVQRWDSFKVCILQIST
jgi:hypothetical protein